MSTASLYIALIPTQSTMAPNPASITLPAQSQISISANCNASYTQVLDVTIGDVTERFQGTGENQPMTFGNNQQTWKLPAQAAEQTCLATFYFKTPGSGDLQLARVQDTITKVDDPFTMFFVTSEDSADNDNNDTYLTIFCYDTSPPSLKAGIRGSKGHTARCETEEAMVKQGQCMPADMTHPYLRLLTNSHHIPQHSRQDLLRHSWLSRR